jgi:hypothetical protein
MANVGDRVSVGSPAPETGQYKHSACSNTIVLNKGNIAPPCSMGSCPNKGAAWIFSKRLT